MGLRRRYDGSASRGVQVGWVGRDKRHVVGIFDGQPAAGSYCRRHVTDRLPRVGQMEQQGPAVHQVVAAGFGRAGNDVVAADLRPGLFGGSEKPRIGVGGGASPAGPRPATPDGRHRGELAVGRPARRDRRVTWGNGPGVIRAPRPRATQPTASRQQFSGPVDLTGRPLTGSPQAQTIRLTITYQARWSVLRPQGALPLRESAAGQDRGRSIRPGRCACPPGSAVPAV